MADKPAVAVDPKTFIPAGAAHLAEAIRDAAAAAKGEPDPSLARFRRKLFVELEKLIPDAIAQAKKGKPALLRLLTRYTR